MDIKEVLKAIDDKKINPKELVAKLKDNAEAKEVFDNYSKIKLEEVLPEKIKESTKKTLSDLSKALGVKIEDGEDLTVYGKRALEKLKTTAEPTEEIKELQAKLAKAQEGDKLYQHLKSEKEQLERSFTEKLKAKDEEISAKVLEMKNKSKEVLVRQDFAKMKPSSSIPKAIYEDWKEQEIKKVVERSDLDENGKIRYKKEDGSYYRNSTLGYAALDEIYKLDESKKEIFATENGGGGASDKVTTTNDGGTAYNAKSKNYSIVGSKGTDSDSRKVVLGVDSFANKKNSQRFFLMQCES